MGRRPQRAQVWAGSSGAALERLILDTTILISAERGQTASLEKLVRDEADIAIAAVTAAELLTGVELADTRRRLGRQAFVEAVISNIPVENYDLDVARVHAMLMAHARRSGRPRGAHDLLIAATALSRERKVVTADPAGFEDLPGLAVKHPAGLN